MPVNVASTKHPSPKRHPAPPRPSMGSKPSSPSRSTSSPNPPPPRPKSPDLEARRCHIALDDETIAKALSQAKLPSCQPPPADDEPLESAASPSGPHKRGRQRFSDMSMSTSSSDSLEYSQSPGLLPGLEP
ncbi:hypothetical protein OJAV_G00009070 [Oryzias javanicus]|uniref:Uncharacterized protein n=1 Tax=Oryzias javanicus TaxID=123683 RepID=A0A437DMP0_ORYJA|nr:hypothetical protein OJAV_G00009070 [Oryzias javanicus]